MNHQEARQRILSNPEVLRAYEQTKQRGEYYKAHPDECPHDGIIAPVVENGKPQPGTCVICGAEGVKHRSEITNHE